MNARYTIKQAGPCWQAILNTLGFAGIFTPWFTIYLLPEFITSERLRAHEIRHAEQCAREGYARYWFLTFWYLVKFGYWQSPFEVEAREAGTAAVRAHAG